MPALVAGIHALRAEQNKTYKNKTSMAGTGPAMTSSRRAA
jgi:hypothetical protein